MPRPAPPRTTRAGHLHATGSAPPIPVRAPRDDEARRDLDGAGLAGGLTTPPTPDTGDTLVVARRLDRGRLCARELVDAAGWGPSQHLRSALLGPGRLRLSAAPAVATLPGHDETVARSSRAHTDAKSFLVIPHSLRTWLGVDADGDVIARLVPGDAVAVELTSAGFVATLLDRLDTTGPNTTGGVMHAVTA